MRSIKKPFNPLPSSTLNKASCPRLQEARTQQPGALPPKNRQFTQNSVHVTFDNKTLPENTTSGKAPVVSPEYIPFDDEDHDIGTDSFEPAVLTPEHETVTTPPQQACTHEPQQPATVTTMTPSSANGRTSPRFRGPPPTSTEESISNIPETDTPETDRSSDETLDLDWCRTRGHQGARVPHT
jgi:hypothetical protein